MHPYHHALSSQAIHGGETSNYLGIHEWFDQSKATLAFCTHRALRHHREGVQCAQRKFGTTLYNSDARPVSVQNVCEQHLDEDCRRIPEVKDWLSCMQTPEWLPTKLVNPEDLAEREAKRLGVETIQIIDICKWFSETSEWFDDFRHLAMRNHSFGIFEAEDVFGSVRQINEIIIPIRYLGERVVRANMGRIPTPADWLRKIRAKPWMVRAKNPGEVLGL